MASPNAAVVLVDSNVFIGLMRRGFDPADVLGKWAGPSDMATCGMIRVEVLRGLKEARVRDLIAEFMDVMINVPTTSRLWEKTGELAWEMDRRGNVVPAQDVLIAVSALSIGAAVLTDDAHFQKFPGLSVLLPQAELKEW